MNNKKLLNIARNKKEKHSKVLMLAKKKVNNIENLVSQVLIDMEVSHEELITILKEKLEEKQGNMRLNSVNSRS